jgi:hypothetical protein
MTRGSARETSALTPKAFRVADNVTETKLRESNLRESKAP